MYLKGELFMSEGISSSEAWRRAKEMLAALDLILRLKQQTGTH